MDLIKKQLENLKRGHITTRWGLVIMRIANNYIVGETINPRSKSVSIEEAAETIYKLSRS